jgi:hypothetical protein
MRSSIAIVCGSIVGAFAIYGAFAACGSGPRTRSANAQTAGTTCAQWAVYDLPLLSYNAPGPDVPLPGPDASVVPQPSQLIPLGWEPFATVDDAQHDFPMRIRKCVTGQ